MTPSRRGVGAPSAVDPRPAVQCLPQVPLPYDSLHGSPLGRRLQLRSLEDLPDLTGKAVLVRATLDLPIGYHLHSQWLRFEQGGSKRPWGGCSSGLRG